MAHQPSSRPDSYLGLASRIQSAIQSQSAQVAHCAVIKRKASDSDSDWRRALDELSSSDDLSVDQHADGSLVVSWAIRRR